jgi:hypothetical protein
VRQLRQELEVNGRRNAAPAKAAGIDAFDLAAEVLREIEQVRGSTKPPIDLRLWRADERNARFRRADDQTQTAGAAPGQTFRSRSPGQPMNRQGANHPSLGRLPGARAGPRDPGHACRDSRLQRLTMISRGPRNDPARGEQDEYDETTAAAVLLRLGLARARGASPR